MSGNRPERNFLSRLVRAAAIVLAGSAATIVLAFLVLHVTAPSPRDVDDWSLAAPLPTARGELATAVAFAGPCPEPPCPEEERLFVLGGLSGLGRAENRVDSYDPVTGQWRAGPPLPGPRHHPAAAGLGSAVYLSGGTADIRQPWSPRNDFWRLEADAGSWEPLPPMPEGRLGHRIVAHGGRLFVIGGVGPSSRVLIYTPGEGWSTGAGMPHQRDHLSVVSVNERIWAVGGRSPKSVSRVDIYDPANDTWVPGPDLPEPTSGAAEGVIDGVIYIFGGEEPALVRGRVFDRHWMLDTQAESPVWTSAPPLPLAVHGADGAVFQGTIIIAGGASRHGYLSITAWTDAVQRLER